MLFSLIACALSNSGNINKSFLDSHVLVNNILDSASITLPTSNGFLTSFLSVAHSFSYKDNVEKIREVDTPINSNNKIQ